jgi:ABC-type molybdate transport system substrate-binding protein
VTGGPNTEGARAYLAFLLGPAGREALRRRGFRVEG